MKNLLNTNTDEFNTMCSATQIAKLFLFCKWFALVAQPKVCLLLLQNKAN